MEIVSCLPRGHHCIFKNSNGAYGASGRRVTPSLLCRADTHLNKFHFFTDTVDYLGHVIRPGQLSVAEKNTAALKVMTHPTTQTELRSFLGLCNVYRRFVKGLFKIAAPLNILLRKGETPQLSPLSPEQVLAFDTLRASLLHRPILALPRIEGAFTLDTDASDHQLGCCLLQEQPDGRKKTNRLLDSRLDKC
jgi:RNase H-like domain found in reverse transcriptase